MACPALQSALPIDCSLGASDSSRLTSAGSSLVVRSAGGPSKGRTLPQGLQESRCGKPTHVCLQKAWRDCLRHRRNGAEPSAAAARFQGQQLPGRPDLSGLCASSVVRRLLCMQPFLLSRARGGSSRQLCLMLLQLLPAAVDARSRGKPVGMLRNFSMLALSHAFKVDGAQTTMHTHRHTQTQTNT